MASSVPVVTTTAGSVAEILAASRAAKLVPPAEPVALAGAIDEVIDCAHRRREMIERGLRLAGDKTLGRQTERLVTRLEEWAGEQRARP